MAILYIEYANISINREEEYAKIARRDVEVRFSLRRFAGA